MVDAVVKQSTTSRTGTATPAVDPELVLPLEANTDYWVQVNFRGIAGATNDFKYTLNFTGTVNAAQVGGTNLTGQFPWGDNTTAANGACTTQLFHTGIITTGITVAIPGSGTANTHYGGTLAGYIKVATAGDLQFAWSQNTSGGDNATVEAGSSMVALRLDEMDDQFIFKSIDESRASTTALADDSELVLPLEANKKYLVTVMAIYNALATPDLKYAINVTGSPTVIASGSLDRNGSTGALTAGNTRGTFHTTPTAVTVVGANPDTLRYFSEFNMAIVMAGSAGQVAFQWAQNTSSGTACTVFAGSYIRYQEVP